jgi:protein-S-isoprenylcysteine O-methyltransferase Ste14
MRWARTYFAVQAIAGAAWWVAVFTSPTVRVATLGSLDVVVVATLDIPLLVVASAIAAFGSRHAALVSATWTAIVVVALAIYATITTEAGWGVLAMVAAVGASAIAASVLVLGRVPTAFIARGPFAFRPARARSSSGAHVALTVAQLVVFWGVFLVLFPAIIGALERRWALGVDFPVWVRLLGCGVLVLASALGIASAITMSTVGQGTPLPSAMPNRLVVAGPYRWIRNPMAVAGIAQGVAIGLISPSWLVIAYAIVGSVLWNYAVRPLEEADMEARFGDDFRAYRDTVNCWTPRIPARS